MNNKKILLPKDGWEGLKENWNKDAISGFLVFLLALPLSMGIAKASEFPPVMGILTAIVGGIIVSIFAGSHLTIKGPAAGLIVIVASAVHDFGGGELGWKLALGTIAVAGIIQILFGILKLGTYSDFFPSSVVHGMLAAIGLIICSKQIHIALGIDPKTLKGMEPLELIAHIPHSISNMNYSIAMVGFISLAIIFGLPLFKSKYIKVLPSPLLVLAVTIPIALVLNFKNSQPEYTLVKIGNFIEGLNWNLNIEGISKLGIFLKYVIMFALVGTIESLLTVKAIDAMDPYKRKSNYNKDLIAVGIGNTISSILGGLPMISEVARSSANVNNGAKTRWANFFHGVFLLLSVLLLVPVLEMIPNAALAAMLIGVGYRLASPKEFYKTYKIGSEQLLIFIATVIATLATDLLIGVAVGIIVKISLHLYFGVNFRYLFKAKAKFSQTSSEAYLLIIDGAAVFSNYLSLKKYIDSVPLNAKFTIDIQDAIVVDHTFMEHLHTLDNLMLSKGGELIITGLETHKNLSSHPLALRRKLPESSAISDLSFTNQIILNPRQKLLQKYAESHQFQYTPNYKLTPNKFKLFGFSGVHKIKAEENIIKGKLEDNIEFELSDIIIEEVQRLTKYDYKMTVLISDTVNFEMPDFSIEEEGVFDRLISKRDINFDHAPDFSKKHLIIGEDKEAIRKFFTNDLIHFFEQHPGIYLDVINNKLFVYKEPSLLSIGECGKLISFANRFIELFKKE
ncbi:MAG: SulP family inorganic anion transporter [Cytophagales bacterium]|nr:MAG: SulP family inorganic anion transporter [Cytophagales bacterium]